MPRRGFMGMSLPLLVGAVIIIFALLLISFLGGPIGSKLLAVVGIHFELPHWANVIQPKIQLPAETVTHIGGFPVTNSMIGAWITIVVLAIVSYAATRRMKIVPKGLQNFLEFVVSALLSFCYSVAGEKNGRRFFPIVATIFLFVITNAWLSLIPGFGSILVIEPEGEAFPLLRGANTDVNVPLALALVSFITVEYFGLRSLKLSYLKKFLNFGQFGKALGLIFRGKIKSGASGLFFGFIDICVGILEALSEFIRIISFTFRLFGNMTAGEILLLIVAFLVPYVAGLVFYSLELLVGFVQALVFGGLTLVFLTLAVAGHNEEH